MPKKIVVVNAGPRKGWNTDTLLMEAAKGALYLQGRPYSCSGCNPGSGRAYHRFSKLSF